MTYTALDPQYTAAGVQNDRTDECVFAFLQLIEKNYEEKVNHDGLMLQVQDFLENGFNIKTPTGTIKITGKLLYQALWRMIARMKPLDFTLFAVGRSEAHRKLSTAGVSTCLDVGGFLTQFRGKMGLSFNMLLYGDAFLQVYETEDTDNPIEYSIIPATNVYTDVTAVGVYGNGKGRDATKLLTITPMTWGEFCAEYPDFKDKVARGKIPRESALKDQNLTWVQDTEKDEDLVEVACGYDMVNKYYTKFAGASCTKLEEMSGDDYPFMDGKKPYIPVLQFFAAPSSEGLYNHGIGGMLYDLAVEYQRLMNMAIAHIEYNVNPIDIISTAHGQAATFLQRLKSAYAMQSAGKRGVVAMERDPMAGGGDYVRAETLNTVNNASEFQMMIEYLDREVRRFGISVDDIDYGPQTTATQILSSEEAQNMFIKQTMEYNASNFKRVVELTMLAIKHSRKSKMPLNISTKIKLTDEATGQEVEVLPEDATLDLVQDEFRMFHYYARVNARSGAYPSGVMRREQLRNILASAQPGSPASIKALKEMSALEDFDATGEEFFMAAPEAQGAEGAPEGMEALLAGMGSETDRMTINPRKKTQAPVL